MLDLCEATFGPHHLSTAHAHALLGRFLARSADMRAASDHLCGALDAVKLQADLSSVHASPFMTTLVCDLCAAAVARLGSSPGVDPDGARRDALVRECHAGACIFETKPAAAPSETPRSFAGGAEAKDASAPPPSAATCTDESLLRRAVREVAARILRGSLSQVEDTAFTSTVCAQLGGLLHSLRRPDHSSRALAGSLMCRSAVFNMRQCVARADLDPLFGRGRLLCTRASDQLKQALALFLEALGALLEGDACSTPSLVKLTALQAFQTLALLSHAQGMLDGVSTDGVVRGIDGAGTVWLHLSTLLERAMDVIGDGDKCQMSGLRALRMVCMQYV